MRSFGKKGGAHEAGSIVPTELLVFSTAADSMSPRVPDAVEAHPARSLCAPCFQ